MNDSLIIQVKQGKNVKAAAKRVLNNTNLPNNEAFSVFSKLRELIERGESYASNRMSKEKELMDMYRGELWSEKELAEFAKLDMYPYSFKDHRTIINSLISKQRQNKFKFKIIPNDVNSFRRFQKGYEQFLAEHAHEFPTEQEALEYYNNVADDKYAAALSAYMSNIRYYNDGEYEESDLFENGIVIGAHAIKASYGNETFADGGVEIRNIPHRAMIYDEDSIRYGKVDAEFVGETHEMTLVTLLEAFPDIKDELMSVYNDVTHTRQFTTLQDYKSQYENKFKFTEGSDGGTKIKVHDIYVLTLVDKWVVTDTSTGETRTVEDYMLDEEAVWDQLKAGLLVEMAKKDKELSFVSEDTPVLIEQIARQRFTLRQESKRMWFQGVLTDRAILYWGKSPYPHGSHPYSFYYPQYTQGLYNSVLEELIDAVKGINKAMMFREVMMGSSAKGVLVVNETTLADGGYTIDEIAEAYTKIGGVIALKLKNPMMKLENVISQLTTVGQGMQEINAVIQSYEIKLRNIGGVTLAQLGVTSGETPTGRYKMELAQGEQNNGVIYDNFVRTLKNFYEKKVAPLCVDDMKKKKTSVIRVIGENHSKWVNVDIDDEFDLFVSSVREGSTGLMLVPDENDPQMKNVRANQLMQFATSTGSPLYFAWALKFSDDPNKNEIVRELYKTMRQDAVAQMQNQVDIQMVQQMALEQGIPMEVAAQLVSKLQVEKMKQMQQSQKMGRAVQSGQGANAMQLAASEPQRMNTLQQ